MRQVVLAAAELEPVVDRLASALGLGEPYADPGVGYFGLRNAVFALGDTFIEVVSPMREGTAAGRLLARRGSDCGYMVMFQLDDLASARARAATAGIREVFEVELEEISEVHLHPADMHGAIVSISTPRPPQSWRWGGPGWELRSVPGSVAAIRVGVRDPTSVSKRWGGVLADPRQVEFVADARERGLIEVAIAGRPELEAFSLGGVRFTALP